MGKKRLDLVLVEQGLAPTRSRAKSIILAGRVLIDDQVVDKAGAMVEENSRLRLRGEDMPFVSRGGQKLEHALDCFSIDLAGRRVLDVGASTGGFTHCSLIHGAKLVYAVDVGYGQLAWSLRIDSRVICMERTNIRHLTREKFSRGLPDFCSIDVAFISLKLVLPVVKDLLGPPGDIVMLIKPQFEAGRQRVGKGGVVRDANVHRQVLAEVLAAAADLGLHIYGLTWSPLRGPRGNIEFLAHAGYSPGNIAPSVDSVVADAHSHFFRGGR